MKKVLSLHEQYLRSVKLNKIKIISIQISILVLFFLVWELAAKLNWVDAFVTSSPSRMFKTLLSMQALEIFKHGNFTKDFE